MTPARRSLRARTARRLFSLRGKTLFMVLAVAITPLVFVWLSDLGDSSAGARMRANVTEVAQSTAATLTDLALPPAERLEDIDRLAWRRAVRVRVVDGAEVSVDLDREGVVANWFGDLFFGPDGAPSLADWDATLSPLPERPEVLAAEPMSAVSCDAASSGALLVCQATVRLDDGRVVVVQESSRRAIRALYDVRYQLVKLTLFTGLAGLALGWWLSRRMLEPIEVLREEVLARAETPHRAKPIGMRRNDEFGDLALAFDELLGRLATRNRAYEAFVADLAHELKNPVAAVRACADSMERAGALDEARSARVARVLGDSSRRLDALVTRFLDLARAEAGLPDVERGPVDLHELVSALADVVQQDVRFRGVSIAVAADAVTVEGASERLETAIRNLLDNAASFAGEGGQVSVRLSHDGEQATLEVGDTGPGIDPADLPRVFDRFFTTRGQQRGTGLGLALTRAVVEAHGGTISARSAPGEGATFTVHLPLAG